MKSFSQKDSDDVRAASLDGMLSKELRLRLWDIANRLEREANRYQIVEDK